MKTLLLPFHDDESGRSALNTAMVVARLFGSYLEGLLVRGYPHIVFPHGMAVAPEYLSAAVGEWRRFADAARSLFMDMTRKSGLPAAELESAVAGPCAGWREVEGREVDIVGERGRLFDLIVLGRTAGDPSTPWHETCEAALFETGRPVLLASRDAPSTIGERIVVAWNGSTETARTVALAMPFLAIAKEVVVLAVEEGMLPGPAASELARHLARNGVAAVARTASAGDRSVGEAILEEAHAADADLLVKGAYTRSRLRQVIFGGTTQHILDRADLPVLLAH